MKKSHMINDVILKMIIYFGNDIKRINHALKVYGFVKAIGEVENIDTEKLQVLEVTAILHDIGIKESERKYNSTSGRYQEIEGPPIACEILFNFKLESEFIDRVCYLIGNHHTYSKIDDIDFQILIEADFLVNAFEDNLSDQSIANMKDKCFKTAHGILILESMYQTNQFLNG